MKKSQGDRQQAAHRFVSSHNGKGSNPSASRGPTPPLPPDHRGKGKGKGKGKGRGKGRGKGSIRLVDTDDLYLTEGGNLEECEGAAPFHEEMLA